MVCVRGMRSGARMVAAMTRRPFMRVRLQGGRFEEAGLPFPILVDLEQLQSMVVEIAKWRFRENRGRIRSPSGFDQAYLKISGLRGGSSVEVDLGTTLPVLEGVPIPNQEYFEEAGSLLVEAIESAGRGAEHPNDSLPARYMGYFNRIGRSLLNDEVMEIEVAGGRAARLTQKLRAVLVRRSVNDLMRDVTVRGTVTEADQKNMTFRRQQIHGAQVDCSFHERHGDTVIEAHASYKSHKGRNRILVRVRGTGTYGKFDRLQRVDPVTSVEPLDPLDVDARLDGFRNLQDGWLEDGGVAPDHAGLDWLADIFGKYYPVDMPLPRTYPMADGGVSLEWSFGEREADVEINLKSGAGEWCVFNSSTKECEEDKKVKLDYSGWRQIFDDLRRLGEQTK